MEILNTFGKNVRKIREAKGVSQEALAERANLHRTYISDIERFQRNISLNNIQKIADTLEVKPYELLMTDEDKEKRGN